MSDLNESPRPEDDTEGHRLNADLPRDSGDNNSVDNDDVEGHVFVRREERDGEGDAR